jgi:tetratricopeptide (TPR) repeat protein
LVEDLLQWAARQGIASASARCYAAEGELAYAPVTAWLRTHPLANLDDIWLTEVARLVPEILTARPDLPKPMPLTETWQRQRLFEALSHAILGKNQPLLLTIDDLQWCDRDTLEWLHFLLRFDRNAHLLIVGAYRPEEIELDHPLVATLQALRLEGQVNEVELRPLDEAATQTLATLVAGVEITNETASILYHETEGNPLFVVETVRAGLPIKDQRLNADKIDKLGADSALGNLDLPPKVHSVLTARLAQLSTPSRQLAELAATIGREFSFKLLTKASGWDEDTLVHQLDELWQRRIVREMGIEAYDFSHDKLREVAYHSMSAARRQLLHRHTAQALEKLHAADPDPVSHQVAAHYERAGLSGQAATYYLRAARVASQVFANKEAITLLHRGLELVKEKEPGTSDDENRGGVATQLWEKLGDILTLTAQQTEALQAYQNGLTLVPPTDQIWKARLHRKVGAVMQEQRHYSDELEACQKAEAALGKQPEVDSDPWWEEWLEVQVGQVWAHYWLAQWPEMEALVNKVQPVVQAHGTIANQMRFRMASCLLHLRKERYVVSDQMLADSREALEASRELGYIRAQVDCQFELGFLLLWRKEFEEAEELLQATYELTKISGIMPQRTLSLTYLTVLYRFQEKLDETLEQAHRAQETAEVAHMPDYVAAAKGNQAWVAWRRQEFQTAQQMAEEALKLWQQSPLVYPFQWQALWPLIGVAMRRGEEAAAWAHIKALLEPMQQKLPDRLNDLLESALQAQAKQQDETSYINMEQAMTVAQQLGYL